MPAETRSLAEQSIVESTCGVNQTFDISNETCKLPQSKKTLLVESSSFGIPSHAISALKPPPYLL
jgi:hypothetical protein